MNVELKGQQLKIYNAIPENGGCDVHYLKEKLGLSKPNIQAQISLLKGKQCVQTEIIKGHAHYSRRPGVTVTERASKTKNSARPSASTQQRPARVRKTKKKAKTGTRKNRISVARTVSRIENILQRAAEQAQDNLDEYLASVADPAILNVLQAQRDAARVALTNYQSGKK